MLTKHLCLGLLLVLACGTPTAPQPPKTEATDPVDGLLARLGDAGTGAIYADARAEIVATGSVGDDELLAELETRRSGLATLVSLALDEPIELAAREAFEHDLETLIDSADRCHRIISPIERQRLRLAIRVGPDGEVVVVSLASTLAVCTAQAVGFGEPAESGNGHLYIELAAETLPTPPSGTQWVVGSYQRYRRHCGGAVREPDPLERFNVGDPIAGATVYARRGRKNVAPGSSFAHTDDLGRFRLALTPGTYCFSKNYKPTAPLTIKGSTRFQRACLKANAERCHFVVTVGLAEPAAVQMSPEVGCSWQFQCPRKKTDRLQMPPAAIRR